MRGTPTRTWSVCMYAALRVQEHTLKRRKKNIKKYPYNWLSTAKHVMNAVSCIHPMYFQPQQREPWQDNNKKYTKRTQAHTTRCLSIAPPRPRYVQRTHRRAWEHTQNLARKDANGRFDFDQGCSISPSDIDDTTDVDSFGVLPSPASSLCLCRRKKNRKVCWKQNRTKGKKGTLKQMTKAVFNERTLKKRRN